MCLRHPAHRARAAALTPPSAASVRLPPVPRVCVCLAAPGGGGGRSPVAEKQCASPPPPPRSALGRFGGGHHHAHPRSGAGHWSDTVRNESAVQRIELSSFSRENVNPSSWANPSSIESMGLARKLDGMTFPRLSLESRCESQSGRQEDGSDEALRRSLVWRARPLQSCRSSALPDGRARSGTVVAT